MVDLWRDFWIRETGTGQQVAQLHERYMMMIMMKFGMSSRFSDYATGRKIRVSKPGRGRDFFLLRIIQIGSRANLALCSMDGGVLSRGQSGQGMILITHRHLLPMLRMSGTILFLPPIRPRDVDWNNSFTCTLTFLLIDHHEEPEIFGYFIY